jgi:hypothetical protein
MKLTSQQIEYVSNYIQSFDIKWYELQVELTDHFVSIMEEIWNKDPELTFHQVKYRAEQRFGRNYFKEVEEERTKVLLKEFKRSQLKMVGEYLKFPKIVLSILMVFVVYRISFYFEDISLYIKILFGILLAASLLSIFNWFRYRKINGERFLSIETAYSMNNSAILFMYWILVLANNLKDNYQENHLFFLPICCLWVLLLLLIISGRYLTNKVVSNIKKQYQFT